MRGKTVMGETINRAVKDEKCGLAETTLAAAANNRIAIVVCPRARVRREREREK